MPSFIDSPPPLDFAAPAVRELWTLLSSTYYTRPVVIDLIGRWGVAPDEINFDQPMRWAWRDILDLTHRRAKLRAMLQAVADAGDEAVAARLRELTAADPVTAATVGPGLGPSWKGGGAERVLGDDPTFLDIAFLRRGLELSPAVCKLEMVHSGTRYTGTGFVIGHDLLLTNHHNLYDQDHGDQPATEVTADFGYERSFAGLTAKPTTVECDVTSIVGDTRDDWAVIRTAAPLPASTPIIDIHGGTLPKVNERVYIIQHPNGGPKKIGMIHNVVRHVDQRVVQYLTDTDQGSSGAPVFNESWQLVALHHWWVSIVENGRTEFRNQGVRIDRVAAGITAAGVV